MYEEISCIDQTPPWHRRVGIPIFRVETVRSFSEDLNIPANRIHHHGRRMPVGTQFGCLGKDLATAFLYVNEVQSRVFQGHAYRTTASRNMRCRM